MYDSVISAETEAYLANAADESDTFETHVISTIHLSRNDHHFAEFLFEIILFEIAAAVPPSKPSNSVRLDSIHWAVKIAQGFVRSYGLDPKTSDTEPVPMYELYIATAPYAPTVEDCYHYLKDEWRVSRLFTKAVGFDRATSGQQSSSKIPTYFTIPSLTQEDRDHFQRQYSKIRPDFQDRFATIVYACRKYVWKHNGSGGEISFLSNKELYAVEKYTKKFNDTYKRNIADAAAAELISSDRAAQTGSPSPSNNAADGSSSRNAKKKAKKKAKKAAAAQEGQDAETGTTLTSATSQPSPANGSSIAPSVSPPTPPEDTEDFTFVDKDFEAELGRVRRAFTTMQMSGDDTMMMFQLAHEWQSMQIDLLNSISDSHNQGELNRQKAIEKARQTVIAANKIRQDQEEWIPSSINRVCVVSADYNKERDRLDAKLAAARELAQESAKAFFLANMGPPMDVSGATSRKSRATSRAATNGSASKKSNGTTTTTTNKSTKTDKSDKPSAKGKVARATNIPNPDSDNFWERQLSLETISANYEKLAERRDEDIELFLDEYIPIVLLKSISTTATMKAQVDFCTQVELDSKKDIAKHWDYTLSTRSNLSLFLDRSQSRKLVDAEQASMVIGAYDITHTKKKKERDAIDKQDLKAAEHVSPGGEYFSRLLLGACSSDDYISDDDDDYTDCDSDDLPDLVSDNETRTKAATTITTKAPAKPSAPSVKAQAKLTAPASTTATKVVAPTTNGKASTKPVTASATTTAKSTAKETINNDSTDSDLPDLLSEDDDDDDLPDLLTDDDDINNSNNKSKASLNGKDKGKGKVESKSTEKVKAKENGKKVKKPAPAQELSYSSDDESTDGDMPELQTDEDTRVQASSNDSDKNEDWTEDEDEDDLPDLQTDEDIAKNEAKVARLNAIHQIPEVGAPPIVKDVIAEAMERIIQAQKENRAEKEAVRVAQQVDDLRNQNVKQKDRQQLVEKTEKLSKSLIDQTGRNAMLQIAKDNVAEVAKEKHIKAKAAADREWAEMDTEYQAMVEADRVTKQAAEKKAIQNIEADRIAAKEKADRIAREKAEKIAKEKAEAERIAREKAERLARERVEADRIAREKAERLARERVEADRIAREKADRLAKELMEAERIAKEKAERLAREKAEAERIAREKAEAEWLAREKATAERIAREKAEAERIACEKAERLARERAEAERIVKEKEERLAREKAEAERIAREREENLARENAERLAREKAEADRLARERAEAERVEREKAEADRIAKEKAEAERIAKEKAEAERIAREQAEVDRMQAEAERIAREQAEAERIVREQAEAERIVREQAEAERIVREQAEGDRIAREKAEADRIASEEAEADRLAKAARLEVLRDNLRRAIEQESQMIESTKNTINKIILDQSMARNMHLKTEEMMAKQEAAYQESREQAWAEKMAVYGSIETWYDREAFLTDAESTKEEEDRTAREASNTRAVQWAANVANSDRGFEARFDAVQALIDPLSRARQAAQKAVDEAELQMLYPAPVATKQTSAVGPTTETLRAFVETVDSMPAAADAKVLAKRLKAEKAKAAAEVKAELQRQKEEAKLQKRLESREKSRLRQEAEKAAIELAKSLGEPVRLPTNPGDFSYDWTGINFTLPLWKAPTEHFGTMETWVEHWYPQLLADEESLIERQELLVRLQALFDTQFPDVGLQLRPFGSYVTGLGNKYSDIDICIFVEPDRFQPYAPHSDVRHLAWFLENQQMQSVVAITDAKVPIIKFVDPITEIHCDMNVQHPLGIYNSELIKAYMEIDVRLEKFLLLLKYFAKAHGILDGSSGFLCSYAYILMAIVFFQEQAEPILPRLQVKTEKPKSLNEKGKSRRKANTFGQCIQDGTIQQVYVTQDGKIFDCTYDTRTDLYKGFGSLNKKTVSRLLFEFFEYFSRKFDYRTMEVCSQYGRMQERHVILKEKRQLLMVGKLSSGGASNNNNNNNNLLPANGNNNVGPMTRNGYYYDTKRQLWVNPDDIAYFYELEASNGTNGVGGEGPGSPGLEGGASVPPSPAASTTSIMSASSTTSNSTTNSSYRSGTPFFCVMDPFIYSRNVGGTCRGQKLAKVWRCFDHGYRSFALGEFSNAFEPQEYMMDEQPQQQQ
ncbi:Zinc finger, CCHC domain-containing protein [Mortierella sp. NVP41]|nr:Zinc finger, CCHC domain-containing protein [Mortierella sp. NVP41]